MGKMSKFLTLMLYACGLLLILAQGFTRAYMIK